MSWHFSDVRVRIRAIGNETVLLPHHFAYCYQRKDVSVNMSRKIVSSNNPFSMPRQIRRFDKLSLCCCADTLKECGFGVDAVESGVVDETVRGPWVEGV